MGHPVPRPALFILKMSAEGRLLRSGGDYYAGRDRWTDGRISCRRQPSTASAA